MPTRCSSQIRSHAQKLVRALVMKYKLDFKARLSLFKLMKYEQFSNRNPTKWEVSDIANFSFEQAELEKMLIDNLISFQINNPNSVEVANLKRKRNYLPCKLPNLSRIALNYEAQRFFVNHLDFVMTMNLLISASSFGMKKSLL